MIEALISSKTRIKLLLKFFLNSGTSSYLRGLSDEFQESTNSIRIELNRMENAGLLSSYSKGNKKMYKANNAHPLFDEIHNIILKHVGLDQIVERVIKRLGKVEEVYLTGDFAEGRNSEIIDLILVGDVDQRYLIDLIERAEKFVNRKVRYLIMEKEECDNYLEQNTKCLLLWSKQAV